MQNFLIDAGHGCMCAICPFFSETICSKIGNIVLKKETCHVEKMRGRPKCICPYKKCFCTSFYCTSFYCILFKVRTRILKNFSLSLKNDHTRKTRRLSSIKCISSFHTYSFLARTALFVQGTILSRHFLLTKSILFQGMLQHASTIALFPQH